MLVTGYNMIMHTHISRFIHNRNMYISVSKICTGNKVCSHACPYKIMKFTSNNCTYIKIPKLPLNKLANSFVYACIYMYACMYADKGYK